MNVFVKRMVLIAIFVFIISSFSVTSVLATENSDTEEMSVSISRYNLSYDEITHVMVAVDIVNVAPEDVEMLFWKSEPSSVTDTPYYVDRTAAEYKYETLYLPCVFASFGILPADAPDQIYAAAHIKGTDIYSTIVRYSPLQYMYARLTSGNVNERQEAFYHDFLEYSNSIQILLERDVENLPYDFRYVKAVGGVLSDGYDKGVYKKGTTLTVTATSDDFTMWVNQFGEKVTTERSFDITIGEEHQIYTAVSACTVTVVGGTADRDNGVYLPSETAIIEAPISKEVDGENCAFISWTDEEGTVVANTARAAITVTCSANYTANYETISTIESSTVLTYQTNAERPILSATEASKDADAADSEFIMRNKLCSELDGYAIQYSSDKTHKGAQSFANTFFDNLCKNIKTFIVDICIGSRDLDFDGDVNNGDGITNERLGDFLTGGDTSHLYGIGISHAQDKLVFVELVASVDDGGIVNGYYPAVKTDAGYVYLEDILLSLDEAHTLAFEVNSASSVADIYIDGEYIYSVVTMSEITDGEMCFSVSSGAYTKGMIYFDNLIYLEK